MGFHGIYILHCALDRTASKRERSGGLTLGSAGQHLITCLAAGWHGIGARLPGHGAGHVGQQGLPAGAVGEGGGGEGAGPTAPEVALLLAGMAAAREGPAAGVATAELAGCGRLPRARGVLAAFAAEAPCEGDRGRAR